MRLTDCFFFLKLFLISSHEESKCLLEQIKIFQCGQSQLCAKSLIRQRRQAVQGDVVGLRWVILSLSKVLEEQVALPDTQVLCIEDLWEDISETQVLNHDNDNTTRGNMFILETINNQLLSIYLWELGDQMVGHLHSVVEEIKCLR